MPPGAGRRLTPRAWEGSSGGRRGPGGSWNLGAWEGAGRRRGPGCSHPEALRAGSPGLASPMRPPEAPRGRGWRGKGGRGGRTPASAVRPRASPAPPGRGRAGSAAVPGPRARPPRQVSTLAKPLIPRESRFVVSSSSRGRGRPMWGCVIGLQRPRLSKKKKRKIE